MKTYRHDFDLVMLIHTTVEDFHDHDSAFIIKKLKERIAEMESNPDDNWLDYLEHRMSEEDA